MALSAMKGKPRKKKQPRARARVGLAGAPIDKGYKSVQSYFHLEVEKKALSDQFRTYVKNNYSKQDAKSVFANPEYKLYMFTYQSATAFWINSKLPEKDLIFAPGNGATNGTNWKEALDKYIATLITSGAPLVKQKEEAAKQKGNVISLSPLQRLHNKIQNTIMDDLWELEDKWIEGDYKATLDVFTRFKFHSLTGSAVAPVKKLIEGWLLDYEDAYHKRCDQAVEGYSHLPRPELNRRIKVCHEMMSDLEKIKASTKATRKTRVKKSKSADKQIAKLNYCKESTEAKLTSINPILLVGASRIYTYNVKYKRLTEYVTESVGGFEISGSTLKNMDDGLSRQTTLRKPDLMIPIVQNKSIKQIDKAWGGLTTKSSKPNPRINKETILLKAIRND
tara:strand:- start:1290 stop:2468 length:1179 start_codon:yes stop_codon:yes gene_type:complete